ncbi:50S ribosomal protein L3 [bacterium]|nr:50S ribosomal protein L3 [bacterium]
MKLLLGKKQGMTNLFTEEGRFVPVTIIKSGANYITAIKNTEKDGYSALQIGFGENKKTKKPQAGQFKKAKTPDLKHMREVRVDAEQIESHKEGEQFNVSIFTEGEKIKVTGTSKGKGYQGVIKRHGFRRGPMGHGSDHHREPGSIGSAYPQHVMKGTKLPGQTGRTTVSTKNLKIAGVDEENQILYIKGAVPGPNKSLIMLIGQGGFESKVIEIKKETPKKEVKSEEKKEKSTKKVVEAENKTAKTIKKDEPAQVEKVDKEVENA